MLPEFLFTVGNSMQEISRDDFSLLNGANNCEKDMCPTVQRINPSPLPITSIGKVTAASEHLNNQFGELPLIGIKLEDTSSPVDLFPTHPTTWQQHPMNNHDLAHHRLQHHDHHHRLDDTCKLLLQGSDDPFICHGATNVNNDDDHPAEFKTLIAAVANGRSQQIQQQQHQQQQHQQQKHHHQQHHHQQQHQSIAPKSLQYMPPSQPTPKRPQNGCSSLTKQQLKVKASLMSAQNQSQASVPIPPPTPKTRTPKPKKKGALKLRFHHQALPPEYLSHYEATQGQHIPRPQQPAKESQAKEAQTVKLSQTAKLPPPKSAHENVRSWLQKIAEIQRSAQQQQQQPPPPAIQVQSGQAAHDANNNHQVSRMEVPSPISASSPISTIVQERLALVSPKTQSMTSHGELKNQESPSKSLHLPGPTKRVINYSDLPYMGEITLDNSKPRRGRKPKKADICHLIYKNYGTIFPGTPKNTFTTQTPGNIVTKLKSVEEPLNLCLRDQSSDLYSVSSGEDDEVEASESTSNCPTPVATPSDAATDTLLATNMRVSMPGLEEPAGSLLGEPQLLTKKELDTKIVSTSVSPLPTVGASNHTNLQSHSMNMYYQKLLESGALIQQNGHVFGLPIETIQKDNQLALKIPIPSGLFLTPKLEKISPIPLINTIDYPEPMSTPSSIKSENSIATTTSCATTAQQQLPPQKRKRSAIFIPPMPAENTTNPATEVSICKFKFTGGAKPTLQEKKMLSVDSDGNYRYYSGTGDKSMRGYEFFPRETLQQSGLLPGVNCAGAFLNATGEKISIDIPPPSAGLSNELLHIPDSPTTSLLLPPASSVLSSSANSPQTPHSSFSISPNLMPQANNPTGGSFNTKLASNAVHSASTAKPFSSSGSHLTATNSSTVSATQRILERKKKPRRSTQREKLEKTFKEKGFLIQTQQLESAEGATYCKFRQLKKFTRYLFRNWKDYLPDELQQANAAAAAAAAAVALSKNSSGVAASEAANTASHQAAIESILASHGFGSDGQRLLKSNPQVMGGANVTVDNTS